MKTSVQSNRTLGFLNHSRGLIHTIRGSKENNLERRALMNAYDELLGAALFFAAMINTAGFLCYLVFKLVTS